MKSLEDKIAIKQYLDNELHPATVVGTAVAYALGFAAKLAIYTYTIHWLAEPMGAAVAAFRKAAGL